MQTVLCTILLAIIIADRRAAGEITACSTDDTDCSCIVGPGNVHKLVCDRINLLDRVPVLTSQVTELNMFKTSPTQASISLDSLRLATGLQVIIIESCDIRIVESEAFKGLYSLQNLDLAYNDISDLPRQAFVDLIALHTLDLSFNSLQSLRADSFDGLMNLKSLDLSYNSLESVPADLLKPLGSLKTLKLENTLISSTILPHTFLSHSPAIELLNLNDNKITQLQPQLLATNRALRELKVRGNNIRTVSAQVFQGLSQLTNLDIGDNPFTCDCQLLDYRQWLDSRLSQGWAPEVAGYCNSPLDLQGQLILNLPPTKFICPTTTMSSTRVPTSISVTKDKESTVPPVLTDSPNTSQSASSVTGSGSQPTHTADYGQSKKRERSIIIGCSVGAAFLFILINVLIICCVRLAKRHTGTLKTKYIIRPDLEQKKEVEEESKAPHGQARVDGTGNGYIISNGVSGFYHTGSRSKLYLNEDEDGTAPAIPSKQPNGEITTNRHNSSIFSISIPPDETSKNYSEYNSRNLGGSYCPPDLKYTDNWQTPVKNGTWPSPVNHRVRFKATNQLLEDRTIYSVDSAVDVDDNKYYSERLHHPPHNVYHTSTDYLDIDLCTDSQSQEFVPGEGTDMKYSTGSGDSGVHSDSPCPVIEESMSPSLPHRHVDQHMVSMHELDQSHISIGSKKILNETLV